MISSTEKLPMWTNALLCHPAAKALLAVCKVGSPEGHRVGPSARADSKKSIFPACPGYHSSIYLCHLPLGPTARAVMVQEPHRRAVSLPRCPVGSCGALEQNPHGFVSYQDSEAHHPVPPPLSSHCFLLTAHLFNVQFLDFLYF